MSQDALATASGVSRRMIVGIEAGDANVSLATLDKLAEAMGVRFSDLVQAPTLPDPARIEELAWAGEEAESRGVLLSSFATAQEVEVWRWSLAPGEIYAAVTHDNRWSETVCVIEGTLLIRFENGTRKEIAAGDFHAYRCDAPRTYENHGTAITRFFRTIAH